MMMGRVLLGLVDAGARASMIAGAVLGRECKSRIVSCARLTSGLAERDGDSSTIDRKSVCTSSAKVAPRARCFHPSRCIRHRVACLLCKSQKAGSNVRTSCVAAKRQVSEKP